MGKAILFLRVSTVSQNLDSQEMMARKLAMQDGYTEKDILPPIQYKESAVKLSEKERQGLQNLYKILEERDDIDSIYVTELSRLSRQPQVLYSIRDYLISKKVQLVCGSPSFRLLDSEGKFDKMASLIFAIFGCFAEQEIIEKKERFARGKEQKAIENKYNGGKIPFGYSIDKEHDNLIIINPIEANLIRDIFNKYETGTSQPKLAYHYAQNGNTSITISFINNVLNNERYTGRAKCYKGSSYVRKYPTIITPAQFDRCRQIAKDNNTNSNKAKNIYYGHHLVVCSECGCYFNATMSKVAYQCYDAHNAMRKYGNYKTQQCNNKISISINVLDSLLWMIAQVLEVDYIVNIAQGDKHRYEKKIEELNNKLSAIGIRLDKITEKRHRIITSYIKGNIEEEEQNELLKKVDDERHSILMERVEFQRDLEKYVSLTEGINKLFNFNDVKNIVDNIEYLIELENRIKSIDSDEERYEIIHRHIKKVIIENEIFNYNFKSGLKKVNGRKLSIELFNDTFLTYKIIPNSGNHIPIILKLNDDNKLEKIDFKYIGRYYDEGKRKRNLKRKNEREEKENDLYPKDKYAIGFSGLAKFLKLKGKYGYHRAFRWVNNGVLKPALVGKYKKENIFEKSKCLELLQNLAKNKGLQATAAKRILENFNK